MRHRIHFAINLIDALTSSNNKCDIACVMCVLQRSVSLFSQVSSERHEETTTTTTTTRGYPYSHERLSERRSDHTVAHVSFSIQGIRSYTLLSNCNTTGATSRQRVPLFRFTKS